MYKIIKGGKVSALICTRGRWYTDHLIKELIFAPSLIRLLESKDYKTLYKESAYSPRRKLTDYEAKQNLVNLEVKKLGYALTEDQLVSSNFLKVVEIPLNKKFRIYQYLEQANYEEYTREIVDFYNYNIEWLEVG